MTFISMFQALGGIIKSLSHELPPGHLTDFEDSLRGSWYISPTQHALELCFLVPTFIGVTIYFGNKAWGKNTEAYRLMNSKHDVPKASMLERILLVMMVGSFGITCVHKMATQTLLFLMQPCHASALLLIIVMMWPWKQYPLIPRLLLNTYYYTLWGAILALIFPDLRDHDMFGEVFNFFLEHTLVLILPLYMISNPRYVTIPPSFDMALFSFGVYAFYHTPVLHLFSLWSGYNLNFSLGPPALGFLIETGPHYRNIMFMAALLNMFWTRYLVMDNFHNLIRWTRQQVKLKSS
ncbi:TMEM164 family-domain-containing protein [Halteromyces radiatus]|uniref:TMEM164 family-domain-containing protein n=1 Tax=Halteromyces radiatus TaxID=101107 RepID=UPI00221F2897|nr:TMEM164 family-domain-containing protein [Halteromyces radiatus]KAI8100137.1 TMEM164 family-domain-containing protein [Halteromyces radiatus]